MKPLASLLVAGALFPLLQFDRSPTQTWLRYEAEVYLRINEQVSCTPGEVPPCMGMAAMIPIEAHPGVSQLGFSDYEVWVPASIASPQPLNSVLMYRVRAVTYDNVPSEWAP